jgi:hypothetical protein
MVMILIGFALIALIDLIPLIERRFGRGVAAFILVFGVALTLSVLEAQDVDVPSIMLLWGDAVRALGLNY